MGNENEKRDEKRGTERSADKSRTRNQDFIESVAAEATGIDKLMVKDIFNACWNAICNELEHGNKVKLHGKGHFYLSRRSSRMGRNPATGEEYVVPEREAMAFQTSPAYAKRLRERREELTKPPGDESAE